MWVEELRLENIKCFQNTTIRFAEGERRYPWITFLGENGGGKSTALQALALLLAGPEGAQKLMPRPVSWLRDESRHGVISTRIHQSDNDPGVYGGEKKTRRVFGYSFLITGTQPISIRNKPYSEPTIVENPDRMLGWLRQNALTSMGSGWFAVGYGAFRRLTRSSQIIVPSLEPQARFTNFSTQFNEELSLSAFERWLVYLDYRIAKTGDKESERQKELGIAAINHVLPDEAVFDQVTPEGHIYFRIGNTRVPTTALSDGYRSILALTGDLVWRLLLAFSKSDDPFREEGVVLIDELDIHLHPIWQRNIAGLLREQFPTLQFIVATHSPLIAAGAGEDALTLRFCLNDDDVTAIERVPNIASMNVDRILQSEAFGLVSPYSPQTQAKLDLFDRLDRKGRGRKPQEENQYQQLLEFVEEARPYGGPPEPGSLDAKIEEYLLSVVK